MKKAWAWCKKNPWKALLFPAVLLGVLLSWLLAGDKKTLGQVVSGTLDVDAKKAMQAKDKAMAVYKADLKKAEAAAQDRLNKVSEEQLAELETLNKESPDKVADWINNLK